MTDANGNVADDLAPTRDWLQCLNQVVIVGRLVEDTKLRTLPSGKAVCNVDVETVDVVRDKQYVERHSVTAFGPLAEVLLHRLAGTPVHVVGALRTREFGEAQRRRKVYEVVAQRLIVMSEPVASAVDELARARREVTRG